VKPPANPIIHPAALAIALIFLIVCSPAADEATQQRIKISIGKISGEINAIFPGATLRWEANTNAPYALYVELKSDRLYKVRVRPKGENLPEKEIEVRGPEPDGFSIKIRFRNGKYHETMGRPSEPSFRKAVSAAKRDFYSETVLTEFPEQNMYMVTDIQFGEKTDLEALGKVYALLKEAIGGALKEGSSH
jgi:hypothetical protein